MRRSVKGTAIKMMRHKRIALASKIGFQGTDQGSRRVESRPVRRDRGQGHEVKRLTARCVGRTHEARGRPLMKMMIERFARMVIGSSIEIGATIGDMEIVVVTVLAIRMAREPSDAAGSQGVVINHLGPVMKILRIQQ